MRSGGQMSIQNAIWVDRGQKCLSNAIQVDGGQKCLSNATPVDGGQNLMQFKQTGDKKVYQMRLE